MNVENTSILVVESRKKEGAIGERGEGSLINLLPGDSKFFSLLILLSYKAHTSHTYAPAL